MSTTENTKIEWADWTWNPWRGCQHATLADGSAHPGCKHCYAEAMAKRNPGTLGQWGEEGTRVVAAEAYWKLPAKWDAEAKEAGVRRRVFCASLSDVFENWYGPMLDTRGNTIMVPANPGARWADMDVREMTMADVRRRVFETIDATPNLDWLILTKRPQNVLAMWPMKAGMAPIFPGAPGKLGEPAPCLIKNARRSNVWLLTSVSDQATANALVPELLKLRDIVPVLGLSCEPLIGPVDLTNIQRLDGWRIDALRGEYRRFAAGGYECPDAEECHGDGPHIDWVIVGGESGHGARPMHPQWARDLRDQCQAAGVAFFHKQNGEWVPESHEAVTGNEPRSDAFVRLVHQAGGGVVDYDGEYMHRVGKKAAGRVLDGRIHSEFPSVPV